MISNIRPYRSARCFSPFAIHVNRFGSLLRRNDVGRRRKYEFSISSSLQMIPLERACLRSELSNFNVWKTSRAEYSLGIGGRVELVRQRQHSTQSSETRRTRQQKKRHSIQLTRVLDETEPMWRYFRRTNRCPHKRRKNSGCSCGWIRSRRILQVWSVSRGSVVVPISNTGGICWRWREDAWKSDAYYLVKGERLHFSKYNDQFHGNPYRDKSFKCET